MTHEKRSDGFGTGLQCVFESVRAKVAVAEVLLTIHPGKAIV